MKEDNTITITLTAVEAQEAVKAMSYYQSKLRQRNKYTQKRHDLKLRDGGGYDAMSYGSYCSGIMLYRNRRIETLQRCINKLEEIFQEMKESEEQMEVNLDKIIEQTYHDGSVADTSDMDHVDYDNIARHFYELGVNARKEE